MENDFLSGILSGRELLFLGTGAASLAFGAVLLHVKGNLRERTRARTLVTSLALALLVSGVVLARAGF
ncbi:MAG TPA: hypothetical protein VGR00_13300 [Thermoanaerobaculia bacterium]|nr:hypothetical protein [Thermoanaerobaculia bacterium]